VEQRLEIAPPAKIGEELANSEVVKVQETTRIFRLIEQLELPELGFEDRLGIASQLRWALGASLEHAPPMSPLTLPSG
jgi:hypothetical protein